MLRSRPKKRPRQDKHSFDHDSISYDDDYDQILHREGRLKRVGNSSLTAILPRNVVENVMTSWNMLHFWNPPDDHEYALDPDGSLYSTVVESDIMQDQEPPTKPTKKKRSKVSKRPHLVWMELHRQTYLDEMLRWAGRGDAAANTDCPDCLERSIGTCGRAEYRCRECFSPDLTCASCCVRRHRSNPFHRIEQWSSGRFIEVSLKSLGLRLQLNHTRSYCENPIPCHKNMLVLHTNGIHEVAIQYCGCARAIPQHIQLLRRRLYPSSQLVVKNCATFELLRHLHYLALTTKASTYDFYRALEKSTNNTGVKVPKSRYRALLRTVLQWRHLKMLKWAGRGNDPMGVKGTKNGELGIQCPSCPWPDINLDDGWDKVPEDMKFLYTFMICMDANFRLKNQLVSNYSQDPGLGIGWAYMVPRRPYENYLLSQADETDISTCVGFQALAKANTKYSVGLRYTGVNAVVCGRSEMILPVGVGNLPKGERYSSMDYIFGSVLQSVMVAIVLISYDVACQWFVNLFTRMAKNWPDEIKTTREIKFIPAIPKLHYPMHEAAGHHVYSLNYIPGVGMSDCECPERVWAPHNALGNSTKTQAPGSRQDVLDDHFGFWNWLKYIGMGTTLSRKYRAAVAERNVQTEGHRGLTDVLDPSVVKRWEKMCTDWEKDGFPKKKKDPYHVEEETISEARAKKELAEEEAKRLANGAISLHKTSASSFVALGLEIEETQRRLQRLAKGTTSHSTDTKDGGLAEQRNVLRSRLRVWDQLVSIYMPGLLQFLTDEAEKESSSTTSLEVTVEIATKSVHPEHAHVWLPSRIPPSQRRRVCREGLPEIEERLRSGQCHDSLENLRQTLRLKSRMVQFKNQNIRGQRDGTRSRAVIDRIHERAKVAAAKYRSGRNALLSLKGPGDWEKTLRVLEDSDIRGYQDPNCLRPRKGRIGIFEDDESPDASLEPSNAEFSLLNEPRTRRDGTGETRRTISWIWCNARTIQPEDEKDEILRSEWAKSRARAERAKEEVLLLREEMRRVLKYLDWKAKWWRDRASSRSDISSGLAEGIQAFALAQADVQDLLAGHFRKLWDTPLQSLDGTNLGSERTDRGNDDDDSDSDSEDSEVEGTAEVAEDDEDDEPILP